MHIRYDVQNFSSGTPAPFRMPSVDVGATDFVWATGIEDTFISQVDERTGRGLDEYALTQHYERWEEDLGLIASLGVGAARYGIPWYRVEPSPGRFDWGWTDRVLDCLVNQYGIAPIVDLVHYGTPTWLSGSFLDAEYPARVASYARAFAERYKGLCAWYTPLNEPRVNAWFAARLGWWPPYRRSRLAYVQMLVALARGIVETQQAIGAVDGNARFVHVDATDLYLTDDPALNAEVEERQEMVFCALDLVQGRVVPGSYLYALLTRYQIPASTLEWFIRNAVRPDIIGYNMYPMFSQKLVSRSSKAEMHLSRKPESQKARKGETSGESTGETQREEIPIALEGVGEIAEETQRQGGIVVRNRRCGVGVFGRLTRMYAERYGLPVMCTETASDGSPERRALWIAESVREVNRLRGEGVPVVGYTYWPLYSLYAWAYQRGSLPADRYLYDIGLWDLRRDAATGALERRATVAVDAYRQRCASQVTPLFGSN